MTAKKFVWHFNELAYVIITALINDEATLIVTNVTKNMSVTRFKIQSEWEWAFSDVVWLHWKLSSASHDFIACKNVLSLSLLRIKMHLTKHW